MSSKKKTKASKLSRMSEEEKMRYLQHRIAMEQEAQRRKHRLVAAYFKNKAIHEDKFSRLNLAKINQHWRRVLREIKCNELKNEVEELKDTFEHVLRHKNKTINNLLSNFDDVEVQYSTQFQKHMEMISELLETHRTRLDDVHKWYMENLSISVRKVNDEKLAMVTELDKDIETLKEQHANTIKQCEEKLKTMSLHCKENKTQLSEKLMKNIHHLELDFQSKLKCVREDYQKLFESYKVENESKMSAYLKLLEIDKENIMEIEQQNQLIIKYNNNINKCKKECSDLEKDTSAEVNALKARYNGLLKHFQSLSKRLEEEKLSDREKLKTLSSISSAVIEQLTCTMKKGYQLQKIIKNCDKLRSTNLTFENTNESSGGNARADLNTNTKDFPFYGKMGDFWNTYNEVILNNEALKLEKQTAETENTELKRKLRKNLKSIRRPCSVPRKCGF